MSFSDNIRNLLDIKKIQIKELSAGTGISKNTLDNYLSGQKSLPNVDNAVKIAQFIGVLVEYLVTGMTGNDSSDEVENLIKDLYRLKPTDFTSIKKIIHSLANLNLSYTFI